jgi:hypothetical protein
MSCSNKITASIVNSCHPVKGIKKTWLYNRSEMTLTLSNNEFSIAPIGAALLYSAEGYKDFANAGHDAKVFENLPTGYINKVALNLTVGTAAAQKNIDTADDLCSIHLLNNGTIVGYGMKQGLWKTSQAQMANDNNALIAVEFATREGMEEDYSTYFCTQTEAQLDALLT